MLNIALPKGRLGEKVYRLFDQLGLDCRDLLEENTRKLVFENEKAGVRYFLVKPGDVQVYVEHGAADLGVVGKDVLLESGADVYELLDLGFGRCRMCVAAPDWFRDDTAYTLRVATKFPNIARRHYEGRNREIEVIKLGGSIELAPLLGLSDVIVDIVETGTTLRENHLEVVEEILPISARLIANKSAYQFKNDTIERLAARCREVLG